MLLRVGHVFVQWQDLSHTSYSPSTLSPLQCYTVPSLLNIKSLTLRVGFRWCFGFCSTACRKWLQTFVDVITWGSLLKNRWTVTIAYIWKLETKWIVDIWIFSGFFSASIHTVSSKIGVGQDILATLHIVTDKSSSEEDDWGSQWRWFGWKQYVL